MKYECEYVRAKVNLVMFSGGVESTFLMWHLLATSKVPIHAHHIHFETADNLRWVKENEAVQEIYKYFKERKLDGFTHTESTYQALDYQYKGFDSDIMMMHGIRASSCLNALKVNFQVGSTKNDFELSEINKKRSAEGVNMNLWNALIESYGRNTVDIAPVQYLRDIGESKQYCMENMPVELFDLTWSCRTPTKNLTPCMSCHACRERRLAIASRR
jgi:hypothetical protein